MILGQISILLTILLAAAPATDPGEALREAARTGDLKQVRDLLSAGTPVDAPAPRHGNTPLMYAVGGGYDEIARLLLDKGANVNAKESFFGSTPLSEALRTGHAALARLLLERGATDAADALRSAMQSRDVELGRAAVATGRLTPLELKAAKKEAASSQNGEFQRLLESATASTAPRPPITLAPDKLKTYAGKYKTSPGAEVTLAAKDGSLVLTGVGGKEIVLRPLGEGYFESAAGDASVELGGRAGLIEWGAVNLDGDVTGLGVASADPAPLKVAEAPPSAEIAPRAEARPWPRFRGPGGSGDGDGQGVLATWNLTTNQGVRFKTEVPGIALSSPIIWGDRIFVSTAVSASGDRTFKTGLYGDGTSVDDLSEHTFKLYALDAKSGAIVWDREVTRALPTVRRHLKSSLANATPVTDGKRVVVLFGAVGQLAAYDFSGKKLWQKEIGILDCNDPQAGAAEWGHASSPILHGDLVLVQADRRKDSFIAAYRIDTGEEAWRVPRDEASTWSTPNILPASTGDELVTNGHIIRAYEPKTGKLLWSLSPNSEVVVSSPIVGDGKAFITAGYPPVRPIYAVRSGQRGDLSLPEGQDRSNAVAWSYQRGGTYLPTPLLYRGHLYLLNNNGILTCYKADTGEQVYQTRVGEAGSSFSASPIAADGRLYFSSEGGDIYVLRAGPTSELLAKNAMDEVVMATPAASDGLLVVRTLGHVVGIGQPPALR